MTFSSVIRNLSRSTLTNELINKLNKQKTLYLNGISRLPKGLVSSSLAQSQSQNLLVICATLEEAGRWAAQLETMGWKQVFFYPTSESSPYEAYNPESEMIWGQMQTISAISSTGILPVSSEKGNTGILSVSQENNNPPLSKGGKGGAFAIVTTQKALQPHLPPPEIFQKHCLTINLTMGLSSKELDHKLAILGYERVNLVEVEGQWSRRGDIVDIFPVSAELPVRLEWFGDELEKLREFDPATQRSLDKIDSLSLTPTSFSNLILEGLKQANQLDLVTSESENIEDILTDQKQGIYRFLGVAFNQVASLLDYIPDNTLIAIDEVEQCASHSNLSVEYAQYQWQVFNQEIKPKLKADLPKLHYLFSESLSLIHEKFTPIFLSEIVEEMESQGGAINLASRPLPTTPHQFAKLAEILRGKREIYNGMTLEKYQIWLVSAQPSRSVSLLQEHDCAAQFIPNPKDFPVIERLQLQNTAVALKYSGLAELEGFILPTYRIVIVTDREFFGQHTLATPTYIRKRRRATSKQVDLDKLRPGDYVVHKSHGVGKFLKLEPLENREYLVIKYEDGLLRVPADSVETLSRYRHTENKAPTLNKMTGQVWKNAKNKVRKTIKKLAVDLINLYAKRAKEMGFSYPPDTPWQLELEDSFPYQATPDQLKAVKDVKRDMENERPMDRLVCGDVGFGKTEVAIRAIFKAVTCGNKQVAFLAPTTILTQQHYHTLKERFAPYPINIGLLNRFRTASERKDILKRLETGELDIVVGTQQLLGKEVQFKDLGLLVIDEEQRFGVNQKEKIKSFKTSMDVLTLSATPIPRTLYMSLSGIREMSLITTPPPSRRPIKTHLSPYNLDIIRTAIRNELDRGGQVFYVVPRIEGIEKISENLHNMIPSARIAVAHGQMAESELEATMLAFNNGEADLLICTTIVESGLDIPRVNTIIIEDSQKFGLAQLYQLRGRVGRSGIQAHAWLLYPSKGELSELATKRLRAIQEFSQLGSGYQLATRDMEIRGVGNLLGAEQSGQMMVIGFELYMEMLQEAIQEIQGQEIPKVEETKIDLKLTAFIPNTYISDPEQKMDAYRLIANANSIKELQQIEEEWCDRYGKLPQPVQQLFKVVELKQLAKSLGFSRIKPEGSQHISLETPMEEPAFKLLKENLPDHIKNRFVYVKKKVTVRGLGLLKPMKQLENLIEWLEKMQGALPNN